MRLWDKTMMKKKNSSSYEVIAPRVLRFPKALGEFDFVKFLEESNPNWQDNFAIRDEDGPSRKEVSIDFTAIDEPWIVYAKKVLECYITYCKEILNTDYIWDTNITETYGDVIHISKYRAGGYVDPHADEDFETDNGVYTLIWYLNDNYQGGELGFIDPDLEMKPEAGDIFIYPSFYIHYSKPVLSGHKYISIQRSQLLQ